MTAYLGPLFGGMLLGLSAILLLLVNGRIAGRGLLRMAYFTPTVLPMIAVANIWLFFYTPHYGLLDQIAGLFGFVSGRNSPAQSNKLMQYRVLLQGIAILLFCLLLYLQKS